MSCVETRTFALLTYNIIANLMAETGSPLTRKSPHCNTIVYDFSPPHDHTLTLFNHLLPSLH